MTSMLGTVKWVGLTWNMNLAFTGITAQEVCAKIHPERDFDVK